MRAATIAPLAVSIAAGIATAFFRLGARGLWGDEVWNVSWAQAQPLLQTFHRFLSPPDFPLEFILVQLSTSLGHGLFWDHLPAAVLGAATVPLLFLLGEWLLGRWVGLAAALLLAVAPYHVWYAQDARPYAPLAFFALLSLYFFCRVLQRPSAWVASGYAASLILTLYTHLFALFPLAVEALALAVWAPLALIRSRRAGGAGMPDESVTVRRSVVYAALAILVALAACAPLFGGMTAYILSGGANSVAGKPFLLTPAAIMNLFNLFGGGLGWPFWLTAIMFVVGIGAGLARGRMFPLFALAWLGLPLVILWLAQPKHLFSARYVLFMQPVYLLMVAYGAWEAARTLARVAGGVFSAAGRRRATVGALAAGMLVGATAWSMIPPAWSTYWTERVNDWSAMCTYLRRHVQPGDLVTGSLYTSGIMNWCFQGAPGIAIAEPDAYALPALARSGPNVWYVQIGTLYSPNDLFARRDYTVIPRHAWVPRDLSPAGSFGGRLTYPQGEWIATLYHYTSTHLPRRITFPDAHGKPFYTQIAPGGTYYARLGLAPSRRRMLHIVLFDLAGRRISALVDGASHTLHGTGTFSPVDIALPPRTGPSVLLELRNTGSAIAAVSEIDVRYAGASS